MRTAVARTLRAGFTAATIAGVAVAVASPGFAAALVGASRTAEFRQPPPLSLEALKAQFRRPTTIPFPASNPYTAVKAGLGKQLFFDTRLSAAMLLSCASCHNPAYGWGDGQPKGIGHGMKPLGRRSPTIVNAAFGQIFMWDGRAASLEEQALGPIQANAEMNLPIDELIERLRRVGEYEALFRAAYPSDGISSTSIAKAIATFERTVVSGRAPFDAWIEGEESAIAESARRGFTLFNGKAGCANRHSGWNFTDESFHDIGLPDGDIGRDQLKPKIAKMQHAFKTPSLREITRRGPYMHDGSLRTLDDVIAQYDGGAVERPSRSDMLKPLKLSSQERTDLVDFLRSLTSALDPATIPVLPR